MASLIDQIKQQAKEEVARNLLKESLEPEHAGQLNFYLNAVDELMRHPDDNLSIGLLLCKSRDKVIAEYALKSIEKPIGVSEYQLTRAIPENLKGNLPTVEEIEAADFCSCIFRPTTI